MHQSAMCAKVVQTFWPLTTKWPPSAARSCARPARSEPAPGSEKPWHQISSRGEDRREVARLLLLGAVGHDRRPGHAEADHAECGGASARAISSRKIAWSVRRAAAAVLLRPGEAGVAGVVERAAPGAELRPFEAGASRRGGRAALRQVRSVSHSRTSSAERRTRPGCRGSPRRDPNSGWSTRGRSSASSRNAMAGRGRVRD